MIARHKVYIYIFIILFVQCNDSISQISFKKNAYPDSVIINKNNLIPALKNYVDTNLIQDFELSLELNLIDSITNDIVKFCKDSIIITQIKLNDKHPECTQDINFIIKNFKNHTMAIYSADTLIVVKKNNILIFVFISEWRGIYSYEAFSFHKAYRYVDRNKSFWRYDIDKDDYIDIENITVVEEKGKYYLIYKIINEKTKEFKMVKKRMEY